MCLEFLDMSVKLPKIFLDLDLSINIKGGKRDKRVNFFTMPFTWPMWVESLIPCIEKENILENMTAEL